MVTDAELEIFTVMIQVVVSEDHAASIFTLSTKGAKSSKNACILEYHFAVPQSRPPQYENDDMFGNRADIFRLFVNSVARNIHLLFSLRKITHESMKV
jgi:hypothetical protein